MPIVISDSKQRIYNSINDNKHIRVIFGNPLVMSIVVVLVIVCIFIIQLYGNKFENIGYVKKSKIAIYAYIVILVSIFINNSIILYDCNKNKDYEQTKIYTNLENPSNPNIISSNNIMGSGIFNNTDKLDINEFLNV